MRVLIDTSVWSLALRRRGPANHVQVARLRTFIGREQLAITGTILQEVLQTYREDQIVAEVTRFLEPYPLLEIDRATCIEAAHIHRQCAGRGIAASTIDCRIAAAAMRHDHALLTADADFARIATVCDLELI
jgi:predicted nucleic acid-binding protein